MTDILFLFCYRPGSGGDVLNDIDNMLQGLTDELDAMLEEEMNLD